LSLKARNTTLCGFALLVPVVSFFFPSTPSLSRRTKGYRQDWTSKAAIVDKDVVLIAEDQERRTLWSECGN